MSVNFPSIISAHLRYPPKLENDLSCRWVKRIYIKWRNGGCFLSSVRWNFVSTFPRPKLFLSLSQTYGKSAYLSSLSLKHPQNSLPHYIVFVAPPFSIKLELLLPMFVVQVFLPLHFTHILLLFILFIVPSPSIFCINASVLLILKLIPSSVSTFHLPLRIRLNLKKKKKWRTSTSKTQALKSSHVYINLFFPYIPRIPVFFQGWNIILTSVPYYICRMNYGTRFTILCFTEFCGFFI